MTDASGQSKRKAMMVKATQTTGLHEFLERQRWFTGKGRDFTIEAVHPLSWLSQPGSWPAVRIELVTVRYADGNGTPTDVYQVPLSYRDEPSEPLAHAAVSEWEEPDLGGAMTYVYDALHDKAATVFFLRGLLGDVAQPDLAFRRIDPLDVAPDQPSLVLTAEQSNTSLVFGEDVLLKVFRRVHHGRNPDIEVHEAFARHNCGNVARLFGWLEAEWPDADGKPGRGDLGMFSDFFRTASDGWELAITSVRDLYAEADLHADEVGGDFAAESHRLGATTAEIHADLARYLPTGEWGPAELASLANTMRARLADAVAAVPALAPYAGGLRTAYDDLEGVLESLPVQRIHGDFHLGQTMRTVGGWRIIDFEGEPARAWAERGTLDSPIRDVAGMLRSFDYAAQHLLAGHDHPDEHQLTYRAAEWADRNRSAFCAGYGEVSGTDPRDQGVLLRAYETDKAVYEVVYEARTRPDWIGIPLSAVQRLAG
ncbi:maltokinase N-terminal cap-like domain-containing protein [Actinopolymorpha alba]|uniref:maltokinase N-terminal cap-like domain-containing protein n=1 Tax=Actinopolymorpha alba TaxID=533267 RepID=UPI0003704434|nr:phosphotransferase [Actinopolymorpha alba]